MSSAARVVRRPEWIPSAELKYALREIDPQTVRPSGWAPPMGGYENIPFRVRDYRELVFENQGVFHIPSCSKAIGH
jgi:hypothetical protein